MRLTRSEAGPRRPRRPWPVLALLGLVGLAGTARGADSPPDAMAAVERARLEAGADPLRAVETLQAIRRRHEGTGALAVRLAADAAACRILTDIDNAKAQAVARAGLDAAGPAPPGAARTPWLRLRVCRAETMFEAGDATAGQAALDAVLAETQAPADAAMHALALMARGAQRSRRTQWDEAQQDLLTACRQLGAGADPIDQALCQAHLANHYRRVGDLDEALHLLRPLAEAARRQGALFDLSVYSFAIGQSLQGQRQWDAAIRSFEQAAQLSRQLGDGLGVAYAEHDIALALLGQGRPAEALTRVEQALSRFAPDSDPRHFQTCIVTRAEARLALGQVAPALADLNEMESAIRQRGDPMLLSILLRLRGQALHTQGRWREAYEAGVEARAIDERLQAQRLSLQSARLRLQYQRTRDAEELATLRQRQAQQQRLRRTEALALVLALTLLGLAVAVAVRKVRQAARLQAQASTDELTGVGNRRALMAFAADEVARAQRRGTPLAALMIDIDHFKRINDTLGHAAGDEVLRHVARLLGSALRDGDRLGRIGGEEFAAVLPGATVAQAMQVAERMRTMSAASPLIGRGGDVRVTVSVGVAGVHVGEPAESLLARADGALYRAKSAGRNAVVADDEAARGPG